MSCPICEHPERGAIDAALRAGTGYRLCGRRFDVDAAELRQHRRTCLAGKASPREPAGPVSAHAHARTDPLPDPRTAGDFDARVAWVVAAIAAGDFDAPRETPLLAAAWGLSVDHCRRIVRAAGAAYRAYTPDLDVTRSISAGRWSDLYRRALEANDLRSASVALRGHDCVSGASHGAKAPDAPIASRPEFTQAAAMYTESFFAATEPDALACLDLPHETRCKISTFLREDFDRRLGALEAAAREREHEQKGVKVVIQYASFETEIRAALAAKFGDRPELWAEIEAAISV